VRNPILIVPSLNRKLGVPASGITNVRLKAGIQPQLFFNAVSCPGALFHSAPIALKNASLEKDLP
jgi:hypothetical protein